jgi:hypothetical protein
LAWRISAIFMLMCIGLRAWLLVVFGWSLVFVLHSFLCLANRPIFRRSARDIAGLSCVDIDVHYLVSCIDHMLVAMSW